MIFFSRNIVITPYDICAVLTHPSRVEESFKTFNAHSLFQSNTSASSKKNECIKSMVQKLSTDTDVIADGSRTYSLPTMVGKHNDLKAISPDTVRILSSSWDEIITEFCLILSSQHQLFMRRCNPRGVRSVWIADFDKSLYELQMHLN